MNSIKRVFYGLLSLVIITGLCITSASLASDTATAQNRSSSLEIPVQDIQRFSTVIAQIKRYYIETPTDKVLFNNAIRGMLLSLDPHSSFLDEDDLKDLQTVTTGEFGGIGIEIIPENGYIKVISPLDDTPAFKSGIKAGDLIIRINDKIIRKMTVRDAINMIRGKRGTFVDLTILRKNEKKPLHFKVMRDVVKVASVKSKMLEPGYGYARIVFFQAPAADDLKNAILKLQTEAKGKLNGLVLDLRNNPGGLLDSAIHISDLFLDAPRLKRDGLIVYTKGRIPGTDIHAKATPGDLIEGVPMVVLINNGSASASEIVAGALQDYKRAIVMGTRSFGKGSVQTIIPIDRTSGIKLTTALYYTPAGRSIQATGIVPDIIVNDLKVNRDTEDKLVDDVDEKDLSGHLGNPKDKESEKAPKDKDMVTPTDEQSAAPVNPLVYEDYQLFEALNMLKGVHAERDLGDLQPVASKPKPSALAEKK
ncbi:MAG: S41 family peptidase [Gammaproteobacteria bacterium]|nr:S41 family peptidase [Gammaproteobacteria bacterium]